MSEITDMIQLKAQVAALVDAAYEQGYRDGEGSALSNVPAMVDAAGLDEETLGSVAALIAEVKRLRSA